MKGRLTNRGVLRLTLPHAVQHRQPNVLDRIKGWLHYIRASLSPLLYPFCAPSLYHGNPVVLPCVQQRRALSSFDFFHLYEPLLPQFPRVKECCRSWDGHDTAVKYNTSSLFLFSSERHTYLSTIVHTQQQAFTHLWISLTCGSWGVQRVKTHRCPQSR